MTTIYIDGSFGIVGKSKSASVGYGVRIEHGNGHELSGGLFVKPQVDACLHEYFALIEGALLAIKLGLPASECKFVTDCDAIVYGNQMGLAFGHSNNGPRETFLKQVVRIRKYYSNADFNAALLFVTSAQFEWMKGHRHCTGNRRADHLAMCGRARVCGMSHRVIPYDKWITVPYTLYVGDQQQQTFRLPFTSISVDNCVYALCV